MQGLHCLWTVNQLPRLLAQDRVQLQVAFLRCRRRICREIDAPLMANNIEGGLTPLLPASDLEVVGYAVVAFPVATTYAVAAAVGRLMQHLQSAGTTAGWPGEMLDFTAFNTLVGLPELRAAEEGDLAFARALAAGKDRH